MAELVRQNQILVEQNAKLTEHNATLTKQIAKLEEQIARLSKNSSNSSKPPSSDIVKPPKDKRSNGPRRQGRQPGHRGVNRQPFATEQIDETVEVPAGRCCCGHKGRGQPMDEPRIQQVAELHDKPIIVTEYRLQGYVCSKCGRVVWAELPAGVIAGQLFGPRLQALIAYMKGSLHASYSGLEAFCREVLRIEVARSHLCDTIARVNEALAAPYEELQEHIPTEPVLSIDESGWKDKGVKYWIWVFCTSTFSFFASPNHAAQKCSKRSLGKRMGERSSAISSARMSNTPTPCNSSASPI